MFYTYLIITYSKGGKNMKKWYSILIAGVLLLGILGIPPLSATNNKPISSLQDEIDQEQPVWIEPLAVPVGTLPIPDMNLSIQVAQSFIPQKDIITRVELFIGKNSTATYPYIVAIRDNLTHENLVETSVEPGDIPTEEFDWVEFDFENLWVTAGETYYIVSYTENETDNWYAWGANNESDSYPYGCAWFSIDEGDTWGNESKTVQNQPFNQHFMVYEPRPLDDGNETWDMVFKTYGLDSTELTIELSGGPFGIEVIIRNIGDVSAYDVYWNITVTGGFFGFINKTTGGTHAELPAGDECNTIN